MRSFIRKGQHLSSVVLSNIVDYLYPLDCAICGTPCPPSLPSFGSSLHEIAARELCEKCNDFPTRFPKPAHPCRLCGEPSVNQDYCLLCQVLPFRASLIWSALPYDGTLKELLRRYKYGGRRTLGTVFGKILATALGEAFFTYVPASEIVIVPIASSSESLRNRGFHHLLAIAWELQRRFHFPLRLFALEPTRERPMQVTIEPEKRYANVEKAFLARERFVKDKTVLLLDDVITTGATIEAATAAVLAAGAKDVFAITLARSPQFMHHRIERLSETWPTANDASKETTKNYLPNRRDGRGNPLSYQKIESGSV